MVVNTLFVGGTVYGVFLLWEGRSTRARGCLDRIGRFVVNKPYVSFLIFFGSYLLSGLLNGTVVQTSGVVSYSEYVLVLAGFNTVYPLVFVLVALWWIHRTFRERIRYRERA